LLKKAQEEGGFAVSVDIPPLQLSLLALGELHAQNMLGVDNSESPFLSLARNPDTVARSGTLLQIVHGAPEIWEFYIPGEYIVPVGNETSLGEGEVLVWVPKGKTLKTLSKWNPLARQNPYKGLSLSQITSGEKKATMY